MTRRTGLILALSVIASILPVQALPAASALAGPADLPAREVEPVILTGAQLPDWSRLPAEGVGKPYPSGSNQGGDGVRDAHNGTLTAPPDARAGVPVEEVAAYKWVGDATTGSFVEIPVQVDERFPYFLANARSNFGFYSGTDKELTYEWDVESWKKMFGECSARYANDEAEVTAAINAGDIGKLGGSTPTSMLGPAADPVDTLDDDDEIVFMADDAGAQAPLGAAGPVGSGAERQEVRLTDPRDPTAERYVYLFLTGSGSSFDESNGYVDYQRDANADEWIDRDTFAKDDPEKLGTSNTGYGPNLRGTVCTEDKVEPIAPSPRFVNDRFVRDGLTVSTDTYEWRATGRWMVRGMRVTKPGTTRDYGADLIDRWKGRAFQQSPDSEISVVGFEDEQVNWEGNSALIGELQGPVRAIRETWGADSGTNVTKTETFYRDSIHYRYRVRVHPIPPDGLYTSWDYNHNVASTYYNETKTDGVPVDGVNDDQGNVDEGPTGPAFFDAPDPTFTKPLAFFNWEQVSGKDDNGSLVYMFETKTAQSLENPLVVPYYRDDACLDDGTGDDPSPRPMPGDEQSTAYKNDEPCYTEAPPGYEGPYRQGCFGCHGIHYFFTHDSDNATISQAPVNEIDGAQWQWAVPTAAPTNVGDRYANTVKTPLVATTSKQSSRPAGEEGPPGPKPTRMEIIGARTGQVTDPVTLAARLTDGNGPVPGKEVTFTLRGQPVGSDLTDEKGEASVEVTLGPPAGKTQQTATFQGDEEHAGSSATADFDVALDDSALELSVSKNGANYDMAAVLTEVDTGRGLPNREIRFVINGEPVGTARTDEQGRATLAAPRDQDPNSDEVEARFEGDDSYAASTARRQVAGDQPPAGNGNGSEGGQTPPSGGSSSPPQSSPPQSSPPQSSPPRRGTASSTIESDRGRARYREAFLLSGEVTTQGCNVGQVEILRREHGTDTFESFATTAVNNGSWRVRIQSGENAAYVARPVTSDGCDASESSPIDVLVRAGVTLRRFSCRAVRGTVAPDQAGTRILLQRKKAGAGWKTIAADTLDETSGFRVRNGRCRGVFRVVWKKQNVRNQRGAATFRL